jgi:hypothetical protein
MLFYSSIIADLQAQQTFGAKLLVFIDVDMGLPQHTIII